MNVLVACEESQRVCEAFRKRGHNAFSCDIVDCSGGHPNGISNRMSCRLSLILEESCKTVRSIICRKAKNGI